MSKTLEYILSLKDGITDKIKKVSGASDLATSKMKKLEKQSADNQKAFDKVGRSADGMGSKIKNSLSSIPGLDFIANPYVLGATAMIAFSKGAMNVDEGMAKINTTAQLSKEELDALENKLMDMGAKNGANLLKIPEAFEKIISQTGDTSQSLEIMEMALKGSVAGFTETEVVAGALAQSLSLIGKENANAQDVLDTFFAAKRVGAGEFKDFANYMPSLIASGKALGLTYKTTAGLFAYMTGKGFAAEKSATLLENAYTALGKSDIQKGLAKAGIKLFDKDGMMRDVGLIFPELQKKMASMSDNKKSNFLESIGLRDAQAKSAIMALTSDSVKLNEALDATKNATGETSTAFDNAMNPMLKVRILMSRIQGAGLKVGDLLMHVLNPALDGLNFLFDSGAKLLNWWITRFKQGDPIIMGVTLAIGSLTAATILMTTWQGIAFVATQLWTGAQWLLNGALAANPITILVAGILLLVGAVAMAIYQTDGWGKAWTQVVTNSKLNWEAFTTSVDYLWEASVNKIMIGINKVKSGWYEFKNTIGRGDSAENDSIIAQIQADSNKRQATIDSAKEKADKASSALKSGSKNAFDNLQSNGKTWRDAASTIKTSLGLNGIADVKTQTGTDNTSLGGAGKGKGKNSKLGKTNEAIATGGSKSNYITINLKNLVENLNISGKDFKDGSNQLQEQVNDALMRTLAMATTAAV